MVVNFLTWLALVAVAVLFAWLITRAWRSRRGYVKWPGVVLSGLLSLSFIAISVVSLLGLIKLYWPHGSNIQLTVDRTPDQIQRGQYLADAFCVGCHSLSGDLPLTGGIDMAKDIPMPIGSMVSANLTPAGPLKDWTDGEIFRALREGVDRQGRILPVMSTVYSRFMSDEDLKAVIAYLRSQPAVDHAIQEPPSQLNFLGVLVTGLGLVSELPEVKGEIIAPPKDGSAAYGAYVLSYQDCRSCHGADLTGGTNQLSPNGPGLRQVKGWTQEQFIAAMRTGVNPYGHEFNDLMPWKTIGRMDDTDLGAMFQYIASLE